MRLFYLILLECIQLNGQLILYKTKEINYEMEYDCLYYRVMNEKLVYQQLSNIINDQIEYCFRPINKSLRIKSDLNQTFITFEELNELNITAKDLLLWSIPINLVEIYQFYLDKNDLSLSKKLINNCTKPWFGLECEYSFQWIDQMSINEIVENEFSERIPYSNGMTMHSLTCYIHLECDRGEGNLCLDWREICDGYVDCLNDGIDELNCIEMEMNECNENEYRCHNGLCIPEEFWENGMGEADCLDRSDEYSDVFYPNFCYKDPRFRCEEHSCRPNWHRFPCGDGQCVQKFDQCPNGRHLLLIQSISSEGNLPNECFLSMLCLTKLVEECQSLNLQSCPRIFQFPNIPIENNHIRFVYENISMKKKKGSLLIIPDYICYDEQLCDCFQSDFSYENLTCVHSGRFDLTSSITEHVWIDLILSINSYFRCCLIYRLENSTKSLYQCQNSSKIISKHRLIDENIDCCLHDDENPLNSCSINPKHRVKCFNESKCLSSLHTIDDCYSHIDQIEHKIPFRSLCDGLEEYLFKDSHGNLHTDESNCHFWPCRNLYSQCDGLQTCLNGEDELNCYDQKICSYGFIPCISSRNLSIICLSNERIGDGINDCIGGMDEMHFCRRVYPSDNQLKRFHCENSDLCLEFNELCNDIQTCPQGDDESFCQKIDQSRLTCQKGNQSLFEYILCQWNKNQLNRINSFSLKRSLNYPIIHSIEQNQTISRSISPIKSSNPHQRSNPWPWYCNRGLVIRIRHVTDSVVYGCMCPPSYYGDRCEYQNERISLTIGLIPSEEDNVYGIILFLFSLDKDRLDEIIESYDQFEYISSQSCSIKLNRYLLFSTRPKDPSKMYRLHINIYEKTSMKFRGSWTYPIEFLFLPVNRLSLMLYISNEEPLISHQCLNECENGECIQYRNNDQSYCRCYSGWSGIRCDIEMNCKDCSWDSLCVGSIGNQSICICPLMKFGPRCLLHSSCRENGCLNNGQCIPSDMNLSNNDYSCICSEQFYGLRCQFIKSKLEISFEHISIPSYVLAYFLTISDQSEPTLTILLQKLTLFQRMITFRIAIPYNLVLIKSDEKYYLAVVQRNSIDDLSTTINPSRECLSIEMLFNSTILSMSYYERMKYYHLPCQMFEHLNCFYDQLSLCLCTKDRHANCLEFKFEQNVQCSSKYSCLNGAKCLQDHPTCPSTIICVCTDCFFGNRCQFYAKGFGLTLDQILGYEIKYDRILFKQTFSVQLSALLTMIMLGIGMINGILSILTFKNKSSQEVGCGIYLLISSICSLMIVILFTLKFWFLIYSYEKLILFSNCMIIEPVLKLLLYIDNWLNACVAGERAFAVFKGIGFNKKHSRDMAKWIIISVIGINVLLLIPQFVYLHLFEDKKEQRTWCVVLYSSLLYNYSSFIQFFHFFAPFLINLFSAIFIIIGTTLQRVALEDEHRFINHFKSKLKQHKHLLISPIILVILSLPRLIISFTLDCQKSSKHFWFFLLGYFISFMPSVFIFFVFVLPSPTYKKEFKQVLSRIHRLFNKRSS